MVDSSEVQSIKIIGTFHRLFFSVHCIHIYKLKHKNIERICIFFFGSSRYRKILKWGDVPYDQLDDQFLNLKRQCHILSAGASDDICKMRLKAGKRHELRLIGELTFNIFSVAIITRINQRYECRGAQLQQIP